MKKEGLRLADFAKPLVVLPYGFWGLYLYEHGFNWISAILGVVLFFVVLPLCVVWWDL